jgi:hypothetical protein
MLMAPQMPNTRTSPQRIVVKIRDKVMSQTHSLNALTPWLLTLWLLALRSDGM